MRNCFRAPIDNLKGLKSLSTLLNLNKVSLALPSLVLLDVGHVSSCRGRHVTPCEKRVRALGPLRLPTSE
jgi:hypothetical protein